jgi:phosphoribosylaminoimidazolecarboxamide formyltransferase / IMP cyclohydrolase
MEDKEKLGDIYKNVKGDNFPDEMTITLGDQKFSYKKRKWEVNGEKIGLRYGDNPNQESALYELVDGDSVISNISENDLIETGKSLSKSNITDVDAAINILKYFDETTVVIMKHNNPSGVASREKVSDAYVAANLTDRIAAFGGVVVSNRSVDKETADEIVKNFVEVVVAPSFDKEAMDVLTQKKNMRLMTVRKLSELKEYRKKRRVEFKALMDGGMILQQSADNDMTKEMLLPAEVEKKGQAYKVDRQPTEKEIEDMLFAWKVMQGVISNSMIFAKDKTTIAIGTGEQDRVGATEIAISKACKKLSDKICFERYNMALWELDDEKRNEIEKEVAAQNSGLKGSVLASDGFLPFRDTIDVAAKQGISAVIQPGGSTRDHQSIEACNEYGMAMVFTGKRVFRH